MYTIVPGEKKKAQVIRLVFVTRNIIKCYKKLKLIAQAPGFSRYIIGR